jgi:hypothetical protein
VKVTVKPDIREPGDDSVPHPLADFGFAPGGYLCMCVTCDSQFTGYKRAFRCRECAKAEKDDRERRIAVSASVSESAPADVFSPDEVRDLFLRQADARIHPYTCAHRGDERHRDGGKLVPTVRGWICPYCDYTQTWARGYGTKP